MKHGDIRIPILDRDNEYVDVQFMNDQLKLILPDGDSIILGGTGEGSVETIVHFTFIDSYLLDGQNPWRVSQGKPYRYRGPSMRLTKAVLVASTPDSGNVQGSIYFPSIGESVVLSDVANTDAVLNFPTDDSSIIHDGTDIEFVWHAGSNDDARHVELILMGYKI